MPQLFNYILHIDSYLLLFMSHYGQWAYLALFTVIFAETGLVVTPFLPGDSLLFAVGSFAAQPSAALNPWLLFALLSVAAILGNQLNYSIGRFLGPKVFTTNSAWFNKKHLKRSHEFYEKYGAVTIIMARFIPIVRSFAPFVAGISAMNRLSFLIYNALSAVVWVGLLLFMGYFLGSIPIVKSHFALVIYLIIGLSLALPIVHGLGQNRKGAKLKQAHLSKKRT